MVPERVCCVRFAGAEHREDAAMGPVVLAPVRRPGWLVFAIPCTHAGSLVH